MSWRWAASIFPLMHHPNWIELSGWAVSFNNSPLTHTKGVVNANLLGDIRAWGWGWGAQTLPESHVEETRPTKPLRKLEKHTQNHML